MKNILKFTFVIFLVLFSNIQNGYGYMRDCSWWSSHLLETTPEKVEKEIVWTSKVLMKVDRAILLI